MPGQNNEFDILTINGYPFNTKDTTARNDIASIIGAIQVNNASISGRINDLNERAFEDLIKISSNNETEISDIDDGMYKIQYVTVETIEEEEVETINNTALLIQKGTNQYLFKDGQILSRTKTNDTWNEWFTDNTTYEFAQSGNTLQMGTNGGTKSNIYTPTIPTSLPANGGNANTVNSHTVESDVPANAVFTDTTYSEATTSKAGLMSANDKVKLNGIAEGATAVSEQTVSNWGFTKNTGTVTGVKINDETKSPANGVIDLGTVITSHQDISGKVDTSTQVNGHALTGNITLTKSDIGLGNVGNFKAVSTEANQGLTDAEKTNARTNIGAGTSSFSGDYDDLTNKPTIPTVPTKVSDLTNDSGFISSYTETDPTVPAWAKASNKPTYTAAEVGALPDTTSWYGVSTTAKATVQKEVSIPSITTLRTGQIIVVKPTITSTVANSTLKLNNFDAYPMRYNNAAITTSTDSIVWSASFPSIWIFDGDYWVFAGHGLDTTYSAMSVAEGTAGTATSTRLMRADYLKQIIQSFIPTTVSSFTNDVGYLTSHQDISGKEDSLVITSASGTSLSAAVGKYYYFSSNVTSLTITLPTVTGTHAKGFVVGFATGSSPSVTISTSATIYYADGYVIEANTRYELNLLWNGSYWSLSYVKLGDLS